jgi:hypothetical protein
LRPNRYSLIFEDVICTTGIGPGAVDTVLLLQARGRATDATGCVGRDASGNTFLGCDLANNTVQAGQSQTRQLSEIDATSAAALRIVFNSNEPAGSGPARSTLPLRP